MERISSMLTKTFSWRRRSSNGDKTHTVHLSQHPAYPARAEVKKVSWEEDDPSYTPVSFTHKAVLDNDRDVKVGGWADPAEITPALKKELNMRISNSIRKGEKILMVNGLPRNPFGRTGMVGRGLLGKYGPNHAADPVVTRFDPETGRLQMVVVQRADNQQWAIPGGMVDAGETVTVALRREFLEEARNVKEADQMEVTEKLDELFTKGGEVVYMGYVDDPRNTDNAWMETVCVHFHITDPILAQNMRLEAGDDATKAKWLDISDSEPDFVNLYASHRDMVLRALKRNPTQFSNALAEVKV